MESAEVEFFKSSLPVFCNFVLVFVFICGLTANLLVLLVFYRKPGLRTTANRFVINLMIINIVSCLSLLPLTFISNSGLTKDNYFCFAEQFSAVFCSSAVVYSVLLIAIDQYFAVVNPLHYHCIISPWKGCLMIIATWSFSSGLAVLGAVQPDFGLFQESRYGGCDGNTDPIATMEKDLNAFSGGTMERASVPSPGFYRIIFCITYMTTAFAIPFGLICFIYYSICVAASGNSKRARTSILNHDEAQIIGKKFQGPVGTDKPVGLEPEKPHEGSDFYQAGERKTPSPKPSFVLTRASPPKPTRVGPSDGVQDPERPCKCPGKRLDRNECKSVSIKPNESNVKVILESEVPLLKPTLKNNSSFTKLSSLHIQFSNSTEKMTDTGSGAAGRRHSNILVPTVDPEFENISKSRSSSIQSSSISEIPSRSSFSTRSTPTSTQIQSSCSSSLYSTYTRLPPSRASSIRSTSSYIVHNIRHRISNASLFRYREEARAARISALVIVMALFCWLPFFVITSVHAGVCLRNLPHFPHYLNAFSIVLLLTSTIVSPFLFAFRNRQIKKEIRKIFQICPDFGWDCSKSFYSHNFSLSIKSQTVQLLTELGKGTTVKSQATTVGT